MADFGYSPGDGTGTGIPTLLGGPLTIATRYVNTTGGRIVIDRVDILGVNTAHLTGLYVVQLFEDAPGGFDYPTLLAATAPSLTALTLGDNTFDFTGVEYSLPAGAGVWVVMTIDRITGFDGDIKAAGGLIGGYPGGGVWGALFGAASLANFILPARIYGSDSWDATATELRAALVVAEPVMEGPSALRLALAVAEPVMEGPSTLRAAFVGLEAVISQPAEGVMATDIFPPDAIGRSWTSRKGMEFATQTRRSTSLRRVANLLTPYPAWNFEVNFPFLLDDDAQPNAELSPVTTDFKYVEGFYWKMKGSFGEFLFRDPLDNAVVAGDMARLTDGGTGGDGVATEYRFARTLPLCDPEPIGQVDADAGYTVFLNGSPVSPGDFTFTAPNKITFDVAPADGDTVTWSGGFFFVCHFVQDTADFEQFAGALYELQQVQFQADPAA